MWKLDRWLGRVTSNEAAKERARSPASLKVAIYGNWDIDDTLKLLSPHGDGCWGGVRFGRASEMPDPDFVLILNSPDERIELSMPPERVWFGVGEPPPFIGFNAGQGSGTVVLTCDEDNVAEPRGRRRYILTHPVIRTWHVERSIEELRTMKPPDKEKVLSWVTSDLEVLDGHKLRMRFLRSIRSRVPFDLYGRGFQPIRDKWDALAPYRYSIAFENHSGSHYFTEKLMDCFVSLTLPLYYGCTDIGRFFPSGSYVLFDPEDPQVADRILDVVRSDRWKEARGDLEEAKWLVLNKYNMLAQVSSLMLRDAAPPRRVRRIRVDTVATPLVEPRHSATEKLERAWRRLKSKALKGGLSPTGLQVSLRRGPNTPRVP